MRQIGIERYSADEILNLPDEQVDEFVLCGRPIVFRAGGAEILGEFKINDKSLIVELAQIDGGGEGILPTLTSLAQKDRCVWLSWHNWRTKAWPGRGQLYSSARR